MNENKDYILLTKNAEGLTEYLAAARSKKELFQIMKIHIYVIEQENMYSFKYIKKNLDYFEYISNLLPSDIANILKQYEYKELEQVLYC